MENQQGLDPNSPLFKGGQEYQDALLAYQEVLGQATGSTSLPEAHNTNSVRQIAREEYGYSTLNESEGSFIQNNCSISKYTLDKVYGYYAAFEMVFLMATDSEFRERVLEQISEAYKGSGLQHYLKADSLQDEADRLMRYRPDALDYLIAGKEKHEQLDRAKETIDKRLEEIGQQTDFHMGMAGDRLKEFFAGLWEKIKEKYYDCGLLYAASTVGIDGVFLVGEIYAGLSFLRALRIVTKLIGGGRVTVMLTGMSGRTLATKTLDYADLAAKYGEPKQTHLGGYAPDPNHRIPDQPAEGMAKRQHEKDESQQRKDESPDGSYRNPKDPEGVRRAADGEAMVKGKDGNWARISEADNNTKGNFGEAMADQDAAAKGWQKLNGPDAKIGDPIVRGIDGVYANPNPPPPYIIADAKYGSSKLGTLVNGTKQMGNVWIGRRLFDTFDPVRAQEIIDDGYARVIQRVDKNGNVTIENLDDGPFRSK